MKEYWSNFLFNFLHGFFILLIVAALFSLVILLTVLFGPYGLVLGVMIIISALYAAVTTGDDM